MFRGAWPATTLAAELIRPRNQVRLTLPQPTQLALVPALAGAPPPPEACGAKSEPAGSGIAGPILDRTAALWDAAVQGGHLEDAWALWSADAQAFLRAKLMAQAIGRLAGF